MEQRRFYGKPQQGNFQRRHHNYSLNPSATDFVPYHFDGPPGPSHARTQEFSDHYEMYDAGPSEPSMPRGIAHRDPFPRNNFNRDLYPRNNLNREQLEPQMRDESSNSRDHGHSNKRNNPPRRNQFSNENRSNIRSRQNSHTSAGQTQNYGRRNNYSNDRDYPERPSPIHDVHIEPSSNHNRQEPRESHYRNNESDFLRDQHNGNSSHRNARYNQMHDHPSDMHSRINPRSNDVRFDENYLEPPTHERQNPLHRSGNSNPNIVKKNQFGKPINNQRGRRQNIFRNFDTGRNSPNQNSRYNSRDRHGSKNNQDEHIVGTIGVLRKMNLNESSSYNPKFNLDEEVTSQRDKLIQILFKGTQECLVCCERIGQAQSVWSCGKCYNILHLLCTIQWADSSHTELGWRCPACQNVSLEVPQMYQCFCKKQVLDIGWNRTDTPHSCGEICSRDLSRGESPCGHRCTLLCHPGPCPVCEIVVTRYCGCGRTSCQMQCGSTETLTCSAVCDKLLNCLKHQCEASCHEGACQPCVKFVEQKCFCGINTKRDICSETVEINYSCGGSCNKELECGNHNCSNICHPGPCDMCYLMPQFITTCCCGKTLLSDNQKRMSCIDPIPTCNQVCGKTLHCGELEEKHKCKSECHEGECPTCKLNSVVLCNCRQRKRQIQCSELKPGAIVKCNIKCSTMRSCGKHKCNQTCCTTQDHICPLSCNKKLRCGTHKCELLCHKGPCPACVNVSFEELTCRCGGEVIFPPVACGTKRPLCGRVCSRSHPCSHPPQHSCHDELECPPCVVFTEKWCFGHHQMRKNVFCNVSSFSCGQACGKVLKCQRHFCNQPCHEGECLKVNEKCKQVCTKSRPACGHPCNEKCHPGVCPGSTCSLKIMVTCSCGERSETQACIEDKAMLEQFNKSAKGEYKILECNDLCAQMDRNRRLALGLQIRNPDLNLKLKPLYPDFLKQWAKKDPDFCNYVHTKLADLVKSSKESKQKSRSFSFEVMNRDKRLFIHGYCEFFGISAVDCDPEPKRNVMVTAFKDKAWLPGYSLLEILQREKGQLKAPLLPNRENMAKSSRNEMVQLGGKKI